MAIFIIFLIITVILITIKIPRCPKKKDFPKEKSDLRGAEGSASLRQGCVLTAHGDPQHITSALRRQENLRDYNIMLGILDFTGSGHWAPFNLSQNTAMIMVNVPPTTPCKLYLVSMYQQGNNAVIQSYSRVRKDESSRQKMRSKCFVWGLVWLATPLPPPPSHTHTHTHTHTPKPREKFDFRGSAKYIVIQ